MASKKEGKKYDQGKDRWELVPYRELTDVVRVVTFGANKYGPFNWQDLDDARNRYLGALFRHAVAYANGEELDPESGLPHLAHVSCNALFLAWFDNNAVRAEDSVLAVMCGRYEEEITFRTEAPIARTSFFGDLWRSVWALFRRARRAARRRLR